MTRKPRRCVLRFLSQPPLLVIGFSLLLALSASRAHGRPVDPAHPSFGYFAAPDRLSELNEYIRSGGIVAAGKNGLLWSAYIASLKAELQSEATFRPIWNEDDITAWALAVDKLAEMSANPRAPASEHEVGRAFVEAHLKDPSVPSFVWAGMLREGIGIERDPKEALAEFLRLAAAPVETEGDKHSARYALREAVITRLLFASETGDSQELRDAVAKAASEDVPGAYYWVALLYRYEPLSAQPSYADYGNVDGISDGTRAGDLSCAAVATTHAALQAAAATENPTAWFNLALLEESGEDGAVNEAEARRLYRLAADAGMPDAKRRLAGMIADGRGGPADLPDAMQLLRDAADVDGMAAYVLGSVLITGEWGERNEEDGLKYLDAAAQHGVWRGRIQQAWFLHLGVVKNSDPDAAKRVLLEAADFAGPEINAARLEIGSALWDGVVVEPARAEAIPLWLQVPDEQLPTPIRVHLATAHRLGLGVPVDLAKATLQAELALARGSPLAALELAEVQLLQKKPFEAVRSFRRAASAGNAQALSRLADCAAQGIGGPVQPELAQRLRDQARARLGRDSAHF